MLPLWLKLAYTAFVAVVIVVYWFKYGPGNFLWFSDIALIGTIPALWLEQPLLASTMALAVVLPEVLWNAGYFLQVLSGRRICGLTDYMFDPSLPRYLRALSLFHVFLPVLLVWVVARLGYDRRALVAQTLLAWVVLPLTYGLTDPKANINWVRGFGGPGARTRLPPLLYLALLMIGFPLLIYWPTHLVLASLFG
jgi:hypothetical protein